MIHLPWWAHRLAAMTPAEIASRLGRDLRHRTDDWAWRYAPSIWRRNWIPQDDGVRFESRTPVALLTRSRADGLRPRFPEEARQLCELADSYVAGRVQFFGYPEAQLRSPVDFSFDPFAAARWPDRHAKRIDYRANRGLDPKWVWELNRCQHLPVLAAAWLLTEYDVYPKHALSSLVSWARGNPPGRGIAWSNGFEAGLRALSLAVTWSVFADCDPWQASRPFVLRTLCQHGRWIERDPSTHSSANNHRIGELVGLVALGVLMPPSRDSLRWRHDGLQQLSEEASRQILPDGTGAEQAFAYHVFVIDLLLVVAALLDAARLAVPAPILEALERSGHALWAQLGSSDPAPTYGDDDGGRALRLDSAASRDPRGAAAAIAARTGSRTARCVAPALDATAWWLFGKRGEATFLATEAEQAPGSVQLPESELVVFRAGDTRVSFDCSPLGYLSLAAHGHADALQVTMSASGHDLVVDPGTGSYFAHPLWRRAFRGTAFHPTVVVDGRDQSESGGPFLWSRHARARLQFCDLDRRMAVGEHDGYRSLADPVRHRRAVLVLESGATIVYDRLDADGTHSYSQRWPLHPHLEAPEPKDDLRVTRDGAPALLVSVRSSTPGHGRLVQGSDAPFEGWYSPALEKVDPAWIYAWELEARGRVEFAALLMPVTGAWPHADLWLEREGRTTYARFVDGGRSYAVRFDLEDPNNPVVVSSHEGVAA